MYRSICLAVLLGMLYGKGRAQVSADCVNAIPICTNIPFTGQVSSYGVDDFNAANSSGCLETSLSGVIESNSAWYTFTTLIAGTLGLNIGHSATEDWDFALYKANTCNQLGEPVRCNFFDNSDANTFIGLGQDPTGNADNVQYENWLQVQPNDTYYLLLNNFSSQNTGFSLQFTGDVGNTPNALDCSVVQNVLGAPQFACMGEQITLEATTQNAVDYKWFANYGYGYQELIGYNTNTLVVSQTATYRVLITTPKHSLTSEVPVRFANAPVSNPIENIVHCFDATNGFINLASLDSTILGSQDASQYTVSYHASQQEAVLGQNALPKQYTPLQGVQPIYVRTFNFQNPNCFDATTFFEVTALEFTGFNVRQQVTLCDNSGVLIGDNLPDSNYDYYWSNGENSAAITVNEPGTYILSATHKQLPNYCAQSIAVTVTKSATPQVTMVKVSNLSFNHTVEIVLANTGNFSYQLNEGAWQNSNIFTGVPAGEHILRVADKNGCSSFEDTIVVAGFSNYFNPNDSVLSEGWRVEGLQTLQEAQVTIYDRYGKLIAQLLNPTDSWDGTFNGRPLPANDYWFKISYQNQQGNRVEAKYLQGHFALLR